MDEQGAGASWLQKLTVNWFTPLVLIVSTIGSGLSYCAKQAADKASAQAVEARNEATRVLEAQAAAREDLKVQQDYQLKVAQMVMDSLASQDRRRQKAVLALVLTLPTDMADRLTRAMAGSDDPEVSKQASIALQATEDFREQTREGPGKGSARPVATAVAAPATGTLPSRSQLLAPYVAKGWDIDIFWCQGLGGARETQAYGRAKALAQRLADMSRAGSKLENDKLGRIQLRPLSPIINQRPDYTIYSDIVRAYANSGETEFAQKLIGLSNKMELPLDLRNAGTRQDWYISVFFCR